MKFLRTILVGALVVLAVLFAIGLTLPESAHVERSITIDASPEQVFAVVNSLRHFNEWSPWFDMDPDAKYRYSGPESGVGARAEWSSEEPGVDSGSQEIIASEPPRLVRTSLDFGDQGSATAELRLQPVNGSTRVTWAFDTVLDASPVDRYFGFFLDASLGPTYEDGLARLKALVENEALVEGGF